MMVLVVLYVDFSDCSDLCDGNGGDGVDGDVDIAGDDCFGGGCKQLNGLTSYQAQSFFSFQYRLFMPLLILAADLFPNMFCLV